MMVCDGHPEMSEAELFADYCERIKRWAAQELNVYIPDPNEEVP